MDDLFSIIYLSFIRYTSLANGLNAGAIAIYIAMSWKNSTFRWVATYALLSIFFTFNYLYLAIRNGGLSATDLNTFVLLFGAIGLLWSGFFKYRYRNFDWRLLLLFPLVGISSAVIYQTPEGFLWIALLGAIIGTVTWILTNPRLRATLAFSGAGGLIALMLFADGYSRTYDIFEIILGCLLGGLLGWFSKNPNIKWALGLGAISILIGGIILSTIFNHGIFPFLIAGIAGGLIGLIIKNVHHRRPITFILIGAISINAIRIGWAMLRSLESLIN